MFEAWLMGFGEPLRKRKSEIKYETFYCSKIQLQRLTADKLSCFLFGSILWFNEMFRRLYHFQASTYLCLLFSLFCSSRTVISKNLPLVLCFTENNFCWQSTEIRLQYHLGATYAIWLALSLKFPSDLIELNEIMMWNKL